jgi:hypothetical protein
MLPGETLATGCPILCPDCQVEVLPLRVLQSSAGHFIGTRCACGPVYTRESDYYPTQELAAAALADRSFGRDGILADKVAVYWTDRVDPRPFRVTILHTNEPGRLRDLDIRAPGPLTRVFELLVQARTPQGVCTIAFAVANSEPHTLLCDPQYADQVAAYRAAGLRSLAVGDALVIVDDAGTESAWICGPRDFHQLEATPDFHTPAAQHAIHG